MKLENIKHDLTLPAVKGLNVAALTAAFFLGSVSYTHLDVYKRQRVSYEKYGMQCADHENR